MDWFYVWPIRIRKYENIISFIVLLFFDLSISNAIRLIIELFYINVVIVLINVCYTTFQTIKSPLKWYFCHLGLLSIVFLGIQTTSTKWETTLLTFFRDNDLQRMMISKRHKLHMKVTMITRGKNEIFLSPLIYVNFLFLAKEIILSRTFQY